MEIAEEISDAIAIGSSGVKEQWTRESWTATEQKLTERDINVIRSLVESVKGVKSDMIPLKTMGDNFYYKIRSYMINDKLKLVDKDIQIEEERESDELPNSTKKNTKEKNKTIKKADIIIFKRTEEVLCKKMVDMMNSFSLNEFRQPKEFMDDIVEFRGISLLYCAWYLIDKISILKSKKTQIPFVFGIIVSMERFYNAMREYKGVNIVKNTERIDVSNIMLCDINLKIKN